MLKVKNRVVGNRILICFKWLLCIFFILTSLLILAQNESERGLPFITNYYSKNYQASPQNWAIIEDDKGIMYFGNSRSLLEYDGVKWRNITSGANSIVRSLDKDKSGRIYYGSYSSFGYLAPDSLGQTQMHSLLQFVPVAYRNFNDVWTVYATEQGVYFQSREHIFRFRKINTGTSENWDVKVWNSPNTNRFMFAFYLDNTYYVHQQGAGLLKMVKDSLVIIPGSEFMGAERVQVMLPYTPSGGKTGERGEKQYLLGAFYSGLYLYNGTTFTHFATDADSLIKNNTLYKGLLLPDGSYALATAGKGIVIINNRGKRLQQLNREVGLQDESVYAIYTDRKGTLWMALDNGISRVESASPFTQFTIQSGINTATITISRFKGILYVGTTNGLLRFNRNTAKFDQIKDIPTNQVFVLTPVGDSMLISTDGLYYIRNGKTGIIKKSRAGDLLISGLTIYKKNPDILFAGLAGGIAIFNKPHNNIFQEKASSPDWQFAGNIPGISEDAWSFAEGSGSTMWVGTQQGVLRLSDFMDSSGNPAPAKCHIERFGSADGLSEGSIHVSSVNGKVFFVSNKSVFRFDETTRRFIADTTFGKMGFGNDPNQYVMVTDEKGKVWLNFGMETALAFPREGGGYRVEKTPFLPIADHIISNIYPEPDGTIWFAATDGLIKYNENLKKDYNETYTTLLRNVIAGRQAQNIIPSGNEETSLGYTQNKLRFEYAAPFFEQEEKTKYQTWLEGFEPDWSGWDNNTYKEYTNLPGGTYHFHVRAMNIYQKVGKEAVYTFTILSPWYRTWWAYLLYAVAAIGIVYVVVRYRTKQLYEKHRELEKVVSERTSQLSQRVGELSVINSVQEGLVAQMNMEQIYTLVGDRIRDLFDAQTVVIRTYDHKNKLENYPYAIEKGERLVINPRPFDDFTHHLMNLRKPELVNNKFEAYIIQFSHEANLEGEIPKSALFVPMILGDEAIGNLSLQNVDHENAFSDSDVSLISTLSNSMSVALENARLFDETNRLLKETEQRTAELSVINSVQEGLAKELDMQGIYNLVGERVQKLFNAQVVLIATFDHENQLENFNYHFEKGEISHPNPRPFDKGRKYLIETGQNILINENITKAAAEYGMRVVPGTEMPKSILFMPLKVGDKVTGYVSLQNIDKENAFSPSDVRLLSTLSNSMSVALENARLFDETNRLLKETEQRTAELSVINSVQEGLAKELHMQAIYEMVGDKLSEVMHTLDIDIRLFSPETNRVFYPYMRDHGERMDIPPQPMRGMSKYVYETCQTLIINEKLEERMVELGSIPIPGTQMEKSYMAVPIIVGNTALGMVSMSNYEKENAFSDSEVRLLQTVVSAMSVALENARLFDETTRLLKETEQRTAELSVINSVQEGLAKELDMQGIYDLVGDRVQKLFNAQVVIIGSFDLDNKMEHFNYLFEKGEMYKQESRYINKLRQLLIDKKSSIYIPTEEKASKEYGITAIGDTGMPKSLLFVPLLTGNIIKGYVSLQNIDTENAFSESDIRLLETLSNSMSVALENARLFDETTRLLKETEQRTAELSVINSVQEGLASKLDIQAIYDLVGDKIRDVFDTQGIAIAYYDREKNYINNQYYLFKGKRIYDYGFELGKGLTSHVIQTAQPLLINENAIERYKELGAVFAPSETEDSAKSWLSIPLITGGQVNGTIRLENYERENAYTESDVSLLQTLANSMSVALENARLFDETNRLLKETEQRTAELSVINSVQEGLVREMNAQSIFVMVGDRVCSLFPETQTMVIRTFDHETGLEHWQYAIEKGIRLKNESQPLIWANKQIMVTKKPFLINENYIETAKKYGSPGVSKGQPPKSAVFVPMIVGDEVKGSLSLQNVDKENAFNEADVRLLATVTNSMSVAIENARLFDETTHLLAQAKQRATELSTVNNISKALASQLDADGLIKLVGDQLKDLFKANIVYLALLNKKNNIIYFPYQYGDNLTPMKLGKGLTSNIILSGEPLLINKDVDEKAGQLGLQRVGIPAASYLGVPIPVGDEMIGVLSIQSTEHENRFNENDLRLLSTIASSVGVALKNAQLFEDVQQAKMEAELASKTAEKANEAKSAFLSTVSHELRTPLTSVLGFAKIIKKRLEEKIFPTLDKTDPKTEKIVDQISENLKVVISEGERLTHLINDVLDLAKIEAGKMEWNQENVSLAEVIERAIAATTSLFDQKDIKLIKHIDSDIPTIIGDADKLIQVVINLFSNAVKFTNSGSVTCTLSHINDEVIVSIADTGIGIAKEDFGAVFEQFKQVGGDTLTDKPKGTGLGLPICKEIVEHHGGRIWLESKVGKGSTFSFALPLIPAGPKNKDTPIHLNELMKQLKEQMVFSKLKIDGKNATILVVDDDDSIRSLLHQELSDAGYIIEEAKDGKMALESIRKNRPDLIILDVMMPEINGFDVAAILKNDPQTMDIPIIILSIVQDKARGFRIGVDRYLTKPIDTVKLFEEVGSLLEQGKSKKKVMVVDEDSSAVRSLTEVLQTKGYIVVESDGKELVEKAISTQPDIIILNSVLSDKNEIVQSLRFEKGLENVLFLIYQ